MKFPKAPAHLREPSKKWWREIVETYALETHHLRLLQSACEAWDRQQEAREMLASDGLTVEGREGGVRPHPCVAIERDARIAFARLVRELDLDSATLPTASRPPALRSNLR